MTSTEWLPPHVRPPNESAGYLGYYTRLYLGVVFDLLDLDGCWPAVWIYRKAATGTRRMMTEKPHGQELRDSDRRVFRDTFIAEGWPVYVLWNVERLADDPPTFPIRVTRLGARPELDVERTFERPEFDRWLLNGWAPLEQALEAPYTSPADRALTDIAVALAGAEESL